MQQDKKVCHNTEKKQKHPQQQMPIENLPVSFACFLKSKLTEFRVHRAENNNNKKKDNEG